MKRTIFFDSETFSLIDIKKAGGFRYVTDESTEMIMGQFAIDDGPVKVYDAYDKSTHHLLEELRQLAADPDTIWVFWNAPFDRNILKYTSNIDIPVQRTVDAMVIAYSVALPGSLGLCSEAMAIEMPKIDGKDPIHTFCKPAPKNHKISRYTPKEKPDLWKAFIDYGIRDVEALREIFHKLPKDNHRGVERQLWELDTEINERGVRVDLDLVHAALRAIDNEKVRLNARVAELTEGAVGAATQREALLKYLNGTYGANMPDMTAATVEGVLADGRLHPEAQELLRIRQQISKASTAKYQTILQAHAPKDHRLRGMLQINGASRTGRYAGRLVQLQNLPRPKIKGDKVEPALQALKSGNEQSVTDNVMQLCSDLLRSVLVPAPGNKFVCCDLSNIEGRVLPWLAGEESKLDAFRAYDQGEGEDIYKVSYGKAFGVDPKSVNADQRQLGKVCIAEGELVLTDKGLVPIERITTEMRVWDGIEWVSHDGLIDNGVKSVIEYDGLRATPDHEVWTREGWKIPFGQCASEQRKLLQTGFGRQAFRIMGSDIAEHHLEGEDRQERLPIQTPLCGSVVPWLRAQGRKSLAQFAKRAFDQVHEMRESSPLSRMALQTVYCGQRPLREPEQQGVCGLRRQGCRISFFERIGSVLVRYAALRRKQGHGDRPRRQQRALRSWEPSIRNALSEYVKFKKRGSTRGVRGMGQDKKPLFGIHYRQKTESGNDARAGYSGSQGCGAAQAQGLANDSIKTYRTRVFDIANAGPRHRFTVSGKLVSNCELSMGYAGGVGAFLNMATIYRIDLQAIVDPVMAAADGWVIEKSERSWKWAVDHGKTSDLPEEVFIACSVLKHAWRESHPNVVAFWHDIEEAARNAYENPGKQYPAGNVFVRYGKTKFSSALTVTLPSGRNIYYHNPQWKKAEKDEDDFGGDRLTFMNMEQGKWKRSYTYGGSIVENIVQATARDVMMHTFPLIESFGYPIVLSVHDEVLTEVPDSPAFTPAELSALMSTNPHWAKGLPLAADGWEGYFYRK